MKHIIGKITRKVSEFIRGGILAGRGDRHVPPTEPPDVTEFHEIPHVYYAVADVFEIPKKTYSAGSGIEIPRIFSSLNT